MRKNRVVRPQTFTLLLAALIALGLAVLTVPTSADLVRAVPQAGAGGGGGGTTLPVDDGTSIVKGSVDPTKLARFEVDPNSTATTRIHTLPNIDGTLATLANLSQSYAGRILTAAAQGIYFGPESANSNTIKFSTVQTPDTALMTTGTLGNSWVILETNDEATDVAHAVQIHPTLFVQSATAATTTEYTGFAASGAYGELFKTLTESAATSIVRIPIASGAVAVAGAIQYQVYATDATDFQSRSSIVRIAIVNKAGTETCGMSNNAGTADASITETEDGNASAISAGTLTYAITCDTSPANAVDLQINAVSSLTQTALRAYFRVDLHGPIVGGVLPQ